MSEESRKAFEKWWDDQTITKVFKSLMILANKALTERVWRAGAEWQERRVKELDEQLAESLSPAGMERVAQEIGINLFQEEFMTKDHAVQRVRAALKEHAGRKP